MIYFLLSNMAHLKYFMPLVRVLNAKNDKSCICIVPNARCSSPHLHLKHIKTLSEEFGFSIKNDMNLGNKPSILFTVEGLGGIRLGSNCKKISLTALTDFVVHYNSYINSVDHVIFPSIFFAERYKKISNKNLYLGSPKYDVDFDLNYILSKYKISGNKNALILFPRSRDIGKLNLHKLYSCIRKMGYNIIVKTRGKDPVDKALRGDQYFEDFTWFPHTSMELMTICNFIINFDSTAIKECTMLNAPVINFHIKPFSKPMDFLYNYKYCKNIDNPFAIDKLEDAVNYLTTSDFTEEFRLARKNHLFEKDGVSEKIVNLINGENV